MNKFKLGNKVKITSNTTDSINEVGNVGVITDRYEHEYEHEYDYEYESGLSYRVHVEGKKNWSNWFSEDELELL